MTNPATIEEKEGVDGRIYYCVIQPSPAGPFNVILAEHCTKEAAELDAKEWNEP